MCSDEEYEIPSEQECKYAAELLELKWANAWDGTNTSYNFPACLHSAYANDAVNGKEAVFFNLSPTPNRTQVDEMFSAICRTEGANNQLYLS